VRNAAGQRVEAGKARVTGNVMRVPLKAIGAGTYLVNWRVLSVDTHRTQGSFRFHVRE
jgi:methionine-rich copper-binding protein CopC